MGDKPLTRAEPTIARTRRENLDLHARHVDARRAFAAARLAGNAELQRFDHLVGRQGVGAELAGYREAQRIRAAPRHVALIAGHAIRGTHRAAGELSAFAVVVAHLDSAREAAGWTRKGGPVERRLELEDAIIWMKAKIRAIVETRRADDFAGIVEPFWVKAVLHLLESPHQPRAEHALVKFGAHDAIAMLARMRA